jgi:hypothetical protein
LKVQVLRAAVAVHDSPRFLSEPVAD